MKFLGSKFILGWTFSTGGHHCMYYQLVAEAGKNMKSLRGKLMRKHPVRSRCPAYNFTLKLNILTPSPSRVRPLAVSSVPLLATCISFVVSHVTSLNSPLFFLTSCLTPHVICSGLFVAYANVVMLMIDCLTRECSR